MESVQLKILSIKFTTLDPISDKQTISFGHSNLEAPEVDSPKKDTPSKEEEIGEIDKT
jgi:hypothetical protein